MSGGDKPIAGTNSGSLISSAGTTGANKTTSSSVNESNTSGGTTQFGSTTPDIPSWAYPLMQTVTGQYAGALGNVNPADLNLSSAPLTELLKTVNGGYLTGPMRDETLAAISRSVLPKVTSAFGGAGRGNNFLGADTAARDISDSYLMNFANPERGRMIDAAGQINPMQMANYFGPTAQFGQLAQGLNPLFAPAIGTSTAGGGTTTGATRSTGNSFVDEIINSMLRTNQQTKGTDTPAYFPQNTAAAALGGAGVGAKLGSVAGPWGALAGAAGGGLLGAFS